MTQEGKLTMTVGITLGSGSDIGIGNDDRLYLTDYTGYRVDLGKATHKRFEDLKEYLNRLQIHAVDI